MIRHGEPPRVRASFRSLLEQLLALLTSSFWTEYDQKGAPDLRQQLMYPVVAASAAFLSPAVGA